MLLQALSDCTITTPEGTRVFGHGELVTLPTASALKVLVLEPDHFRILKPTPLIPGVAVRWLLSDDRSRGPGIVQFVDGTLPDRRISVLIGEELCWIHEIDVFEIDPWPAIDAQLEEAWPHLAIDGEESAVVSAVKEWLCKHFFED